MSRLNRHYAARWWKAAGERRNADCEAVTVRLAKSSAFATESSEPSDLATPAATKLSDRRLYSREIIHNPEVNEQIAALGIKNLARQRQRSRGEQSGGGRRGHRARLLAPT